MIILYNQTDITELVKVETCQHELYLQDKADTVDILFDNEDGRWTNWKPELDDTIEISEDYAKTGKMYIYRIIPQNKYLRIKASTLKKGNMLPQRKSWEHVYFKQICKEIADRNNMKVSYFGITDYLYGYVTQQEDDFTFLNFRCKLENYSFVIYNDTICIYSMDYMESFDPLVTIQLDINSDFKFNNQIEYGSSIITNGSFVGKYTENEEKALFEKNISCNIQSLAEANRYAENFLKEKNRKSHIGILKTNKCMTGLVPGSIVSLVTDIEEWKTNVMVIRMRNDYIKGKSKVWIRRLK
ncbi:MAG: hypothetical protein PHX08_11685 [Lachnospiraceae bacterium]|nr:hypothetical protein [Lachnospiraceae bacterium]